MGRGFKALRPLVKFHHHLPIGLQHIWYGAWKSGVNNYDAIIVFETYWTAKLVQYLRAGNSRCRVIVYFINPITDARARSSVAFLRRWPCELYSFDKGDCAAFGMKYNPWHLPTIYPVKCVPALYDTFFIGKDKGRLDALIQLKTTLDDRGYRNRFLIVKDKRKEYAASQLQYLSDDHVSYEAVVEMIQQSRCLVEILQPGQSGITERSMEALVYRKKLITNNRDIAGYDFYRKENIFILGQDSLETLEAFMNSPSVRVDESIPLRYTHEAWVQRFFETYTGP